MPDAIAVTHVEALLPACAAEIEAQFVELVESWHQRAWKDDQVKSLTATDKLYALLFRTYPQSKSISKARLNHVELLGQLAKHDYTEWARVADALELVVADVSLRRGNRVDAAYDYYIATMNMTPQQPLRIINACLSYAALAERGDRFRLELLLVAARMQIERKAFADALTYLDEVLAIDPGPEASRQAKNLRRKALKGLDRKQ